MSRMLQRLLPLALVFALFTGAGASPACGPVAGQCICPQGTVLQGRECVREPVCNPPAKLNRRGACACPTDMVARGDGCVQRERPHEQPAVTPGRTITIPGNGRDNPAGPRGGRDTDSPRGNSQGPADLPGRR
jgi:hypothetical protein